VRAVFGAHADRLSATSTKSMTGHMLGAAGAVEAIASVLALLHGIVPPTINFTTADPACDLRYVFNAPERRAVRVALSNAFGFGGKNTCAVFAAYDGQSGRTPIRGGQGAPPDRPVQSTERAEHDAAAAAHAERPQAW
jgi:acyl transferase domain-containing protein